MAIPATIATKPASHKRFITVKRLVFFQLAHGPIPINTNNGAVRGTKTLLKYGGPTEILPKCSASISRGYKVPSNIEPAETTKNTLPSKMSVSRELKLNLPPMVLFGARHA